MVMTEAQRRLSKTSNSLSKSVSERSDWRSSQATGGDVGLRVNPSPDHREESTPPAKKARSSRKVHFEESGSGSSSKKKSRKKLKKVGCTYVCILCNIWSVLVSLLSSFAVGFAHAIVHTPVCPAT